MIKKLLILLTTTFLTTTFLLSQPQTRVDDLIALTGDSPSNFTPAEIHGLQRICDLYNSPDLDKIFDTYSKSKGERIEHINVLWQVMNGYPDLKHENIPTKQIHWKIVCNISPTERKTTQFHLDYVVKKTDLGKIEGIQTQISSYLGLSNSIECVQYQLNKFSYGCSPYEKEISSTIDIKNSMNMFFGHCYGYWTIVDLSGKEYKIKDDNFDGYWHSHKKEDHTSKSLRYVNKLLPLNRMPSLQPVYKDQRADDIMQFMFAERIQSKFNLLAPENDYDGNLRHYVLMSCFDENNV